MDVFVSLKGPILRQARGEASIYVDFVVDRRTKAKSWDQTFGLLLNWISSMTSYINDTKFELLSAR